MAFLHIMTVSCFSFRRFQFASLNGRKQVIGHAGGYRGQQEKHYGLLASSKAKNLTPYGI